MTRWFPPFTNALARASLAAVVILVIVLGCAMWGVENSSYVTSQQIMLEQPVPFSHEHHVGGLGIDCRYCHTSVAESSFAGMPPTKTCMTCHSQIWTNAAMLEPVRDSWRSGVPIRWQRVNTLPQYVYFDHSIHIQKGVGCTTCHGQVNEMPLMLQNAPLQMSWCVNCHREPAKFLRPRDEVFSMSYRPPENQLALGRDLCERYHVRSSQALTDCYTCHR